ncbi:GAK system CofD-like protein [Rhodobacteraceae bacterium]|nr:GAK system CofD-like protein [Paracoccaceae bacterium]
MTVAYVERALRLPDDLRVARARSAPHLGPRILFFSGGSALNGISRKLKSYTHNTIHLITPFDSGGSSQELRRVFDMPAVGDLRARLMALADESILGQPDIYALFSHRLPKDAPQDVLRAEVAQMIGGRHRLVASVVKPMRQLILSHLEHFAAHVPEDFDYRHASVGNLILAGGYLGHGRALEPVLFLMSKMVDVRGIVRAIVDDNLQLGVDLANGRRVISQRMISGKETPPLESPITRCFLSDGTTECGAVSLPARNHQLIGQADVICYPPGSLYSSVVANLLPQGVGRAVAARHIPKVYLPSLGRDPEALGHDLVDQVGAILAPMLADAGDGIAPVRLMTHVLCDHTWSTAQCDAVHARYGIACVRLPLQMADAVKYDPAKIAKILVSLD